MKYTGDNPYFQAHYVRV